MLGIGPRSSCRNWFKKLNIEFQVCIFLLLMMFVVNNSDKFHANSSIHCTNMKHKVNYTHLWQNILPFNTVLPTPL